MNVLRLAPILLAIFAMPAVLLAQDEAPAPPPADNSITTDAPPPAPASNGVLATDDMVKVLDKATADQDGKPSPWAAPVRLAVVFTVLALLPSLLVMATSFTRIVIVLSFVRRALTTQTIPPTVAVIGLAIFLTMFTMADTFTRINDTAVQPYLKDEMPFDQACSAGSSALKDFMIRQTRTEDIGLFMGLGKMEPAKNAADLPMHVLVPAFAISEFRTAFEIGCLLFIPFLLVDLVISGILLSAGMMMLPPSMISLPFKVILFVLVDGWRLIASSLVGSFH
jgi:flagellar biosynthetic protein FliP